MGKQDLKIIFFLVISDALVNTDQRDIRGQPLTGLHADDAPSFLKIEI